VTTTSRSVSRCEHSGNKLASSNKEKRYQEFHEWINARTRNKRIKEEIAGIEKLDVKNFKKIIRKLTEAYFQNFGSQRNGFSFFKEHLKI